MNELNGEWHNEYGSRMTLHVDDHGLVRGTFKSGVGLARPGEEFDLVGFATGDLLGFVVNFGKHDTITTWSGHLVFERGVPKIRAMWHMTITPPISRGREELWKGTFTGVDVFDREPPSSARLHSMPSHPVSWPDLFTSPAIPGARRPPER